LLRRDDDRITCRRLTFSPSISPEKIFFSTLFEAALLKTKSCRAEPRGSARAPVMPRHIHVAFTEDVAMRTFDFTPYYRSTVGFDRLFDLLDQSIRSDWPLQHREEKRRPVPDHHDRRRLCCERNRIVQHGYAPGDGPEG